MTVRVAFTLALALLRPLPGCAQNLQGRFYPEKDSYMLGEPVLFNLEIKNPGPDTTYINAKNPDKCVDTYDFSVTGTGMSCSTQWNDYCLSEQLTLAPGDSTHKQWPLNHWFQFEREGKYQVGVTRHIPIRSTRGDFQDFSFTSKFEVRVEPPDPVRVQSILQDFEQNLHSSDPEVRHVALDVLATTAPSYFQSVALKLVRGDDGFAAIHAAVALGHMNTPETRAALADLVTAGNETADEGEGYNVVARARALDGLGDSGDTSYLSFVEHYIHDKNWGIQLAAMKATAQLGKAAVVPELEQFLSSADATTRRNAAWALDHSPSREAVEALIAALSDKEPEVREHALNSLKVLTGHRVGDEDGVSPEEMQSKWRTWWQANKDKAALNEFNSVCHLK